GEGQEHVDAVGAYARGAIVAAGDEDHAVGDRRAHAVDAAAGLALDAVDGVVGLRGRRILPDDLAGGRVVSAEPAVEAALEHHARDHRRRGGLAADAAAGLALVGRVDARRLGRGGRPEDRAA